MRMTVCTLILFTGLPLMGLLGCGGAAPIPCVTSFSLGAVARNTANPSTGGMADHTAKAPGNQQQFAATSGTVAVSGPCALPALVEIVNAQWTVSDNIDVQISSAPDATNGLATCTGATLTPATVTASYTQGGVTKAASTTLTCQ